MLLTWVDAENTAPSPSEYSFGTCLFPFFFLPSFGALVSFLPFTSISKSSHSPVCMSLPFLQYPGWPDVAVASQKTQSRI